VPARRRDPRCHATRSRPRCSTWSGDAPPRPRCPPLPSSLPCVSVALPYSTRPRPPAPSISRVSMRNVQSLSPDMETSQSRTTSHSHPTSCPRQSAMAIRQVARVYNAITHEVPSRVYLCGFGTRRAHRPVSSSVRNVCRM
jgi:hypothetical protein